MENPKPPLPPSPSTSKTAALDTPLHAFGFQIEDLSPQKVTGRLLVSPNCCQPFKVLHGGVSAMIAEALASLGAQVASNYQRVAGIHLSISHLKSAVVGDVVLAEAVPIFVGKTIQVWEVKLWKESLKEGRTLVSSSKVTLRSNMRVPEQAQDFMDTLKKYSKL